MPLSRRDLARRAARVSGLGLGIPAVAWILFAMLFGDRFVFFPSRHPEGDWEAKLRSPNPVEDAVIRAADGVEIHGWFVRPPGARAAILVLHGNGGNITHRADLLFHLQSIPAAVLLVDYRGYGRSGGDPSEAGVRADAEAAHDWLKERGFPPERIILYGESLGAAVAVDLAGRRPVGGVILQCAFTSVGDMAKRVMPLVPTGWFMKSKFASIDKIGAIRVPKLHFHGRADEVVPFELGRALFDAAAEPKRWIEYPEMTHNEWPGRRTEEWLREVSAFVKEIAK